MMGQIAMYLLPYTNKILVISHKYEDLLHKDIGHYFKLK